MNAHPPPPYAPPPYAPPPYGRAPEPEPDRAAALWRRGAAWTLDFALVIAVAFALGTWTWTRISSLLASVPRLAGKGVWSFLSSREDAGKASAGFGMSVWNTASGYVVQAFAILVVLVFLYHFVALSWKGRTVGMLVLDLRVEAQGRDRLGKGRSLGRAAVSAVADVGLYALACCLLLWGDFVLAVTCWVLAVAVFWLNVLPALFPGRRTLHDRMAGTRVAPANLFRAAAGQAAQGGRVALQSAQRIADHERVRGVADQGRRALGRARGSSEGERPAIAPPQPAFQPQAFHQPGHPQQRPPQPHPQPQHQFQPPYPPQGGAYRQPIPRPEEH